MYRVLHIFSSYGGGISSLVLNLVNYSGKEYQFDTLAYSYQGGDCFVASVENSGGSCFLMPRVSTEGIGRNIAFLKNFFEKNIYDVIHCHISGIDACLYKKLAKKNNQNVKFIIHAHSTRYDFAPYRLRIVRIINEYVNFKVSECFFYCSDLAANYSFNTKYLNQKPSYLIANGVDINKYNFVISDEEIVKIKEEIGIPKDNKVIIHIGRFSKAKNHEFLLHVFKGINQNMSDTTLILVGDGELFDVTFEKSKIMGLENDVLFLGRRTDVAQLLKISDLMLLPSLYEGLPTVGIECQATGTPLVLSDNVTKQTDLGFGLLTFLPLNNVDKWIEVSTLLLQDNGHTHHNNIFDIHEKGFTAQAVGERYSNLLKAIIKGEIG